MKLVLTIIRYFVGILFIFSGLVKANDPLGLSYKMQEFFEVWGLHGLSDYTLVFSILMIAFEIIAGVAVIIGWKMRLFSWLLLLLMIFFTFLTAYAVFSGKIKECGCFGDCIPLSALQSFWKDVILLILIIVLFINRHKIESRISTRWALISLGLTIAFSFKLMGHVMTHLPIVDCLPYKKGNNLVEQMSIPPGAIPDSTVITFVYNMNGQKLEFTADNFPDDFDEDVYQFVDRYDKVVRKGNATPKIRDFILADYSGTDLTYELLEKDRYQVYVFLKDELKPGKWQDELKAFNTYLDGQQIEKYLVSNLSETEAQKVAAQYFPGYQLLRSDATAIKTAARVNPSILLVKKGTVLDKQSINDIETMTENIKKY
ncbi:BT_3928 family protein [Gynurincola endophyticus]|uniref:BT_3928 family protein n=1 Tax=Gynurincola endophyticus TaxID=2479004 RepID=UPI000F8ECC70|nr:BT_3928 family protein [Gynurincola endophyticus]